MSILVDDLCHSVLIKLQLRLLQTMFFELLRDKVILGYLILFLSEVTAHIDHFHTVFKSRLDSLDIVGGCNEKHI